MVHGFWRVPFIVAWSPDFGQVSGQNIIMGERGRAKLLISWQLENGEGEVSGLKDIPSHPLLPTRPHP